MFLHSEQQAWLKVNCQSVVRSCASRSHRPYAATTVSWDLSRIKEDGVVGPVPGALLLLPQLRDGELAARLGEVPPDRSFHFDAAGFHSTLKTSQGSVHHCSI